jgi:hypothetical protein
MDVICLFFLSVVFFCAFLMDTLYGDGKRINVKDKLGRMYKKSAVVCFSKVHQQLHGEIVTARKKRQSGLLSFELRIESQISKILIRHTD